MIITKENRKQAKKYDVQYFLKPSSKRPFACSTVATKLTIEVFYEEFGDLRDVYNAINYDNEAKEIVKYYIDNGIYTFW